MGTSRTKVVHRLTRAQERQRPVTIHRKHLDADVTSGFVLTVLEEWVVIQDLLVGAHLDAVVLLRLDQVTKVKKHDNCAFVRRAVAGHGVRPAGFECPQDATTGDLLRLADTRSDLICTYLETRDSYWLNIGKVLRIGNKRLDLHFIGKDGVWADFAESWKLTDITRIEFGGRYIQALEKFGEPAPEVTKTVRR